jgi:thiol-disulfide isomerase/thioredoxin
MSKSLFFFATCGCAAAIMLVTAAAATAHADPKAQALLQKVEAATESAQTMTADLVRVGMDGKPIEAMVRLMKPNYAHVVYKSAKAPTSAAAAPIYVASDGKTRWRYPDAGKSEYRTEVADPVGKGTVDWLDGLPVQAFFGLEAALKDGGIDADALKHAGTRTWNGQTFQVLQHDFTQYGKRYTAWLYVGPDNLIHRHVGTFYIPKSDGTPQTFEVALRNVKRNVPMRAAQFAYVPPKEARPIVEKPLLAPGTIAPDFVAEDRNGRPVRLSDLHGKVVVLDFWATWCLPCLRAMTHTNAIAAKFKDENVVVLAVNVMDSRQAFQSWLAKHPEYGALVFVVDPSPSGKDVATTLYQVSAIPTQYVIGKDGRVVKSLFGYSGPTPDLENAVRAAAARPAQAAR